MTEDFVHADFTLGTLDLKDLDRDPFQQFKKWYNEVQETGISENYAMTLATCGASGRPAARIVYLRGFDARGFTFYTNYNSRKGEELAQNPYAALCFYWKELERQVRLEGRVEKVPTEESDAYFHGRPINSKLGAWASTQSGTLESAAALFARVAEYRNKFENQEIPRPEHWGGYRLMPNLFEFWQGRPSRLHDRFEYLQDGEGGWTLTRLNP